MHVTIWTITSLVGSTIWVGIIASLSKGWVGWEILGISDSGLFHSDQFWAQKIEDGELGWSQQNQEKKTEREREAKHCSCFSKWWHYSNPPIWTLNSPSPLPYLSSRQMQAENDQRSQEGYLWLLTSEKRQSASRAKWKRGNGNQRLRSIGLPSLPLAQLILNHDSGVSVVLAIHIEIWLRLLIVLLTCELKVCVFS